MILGWGWRLLLPRGGDLVEASCFARKLICFGNPLEVAVRGHLLRMLSDLVQHSRVVLLRTWISNFVLAFWRIEFLGLLLLILKSGNLLVSNVIVSLVLLHISTLGGVGILSVFNQPFVFELSAVQQLPLTRQCLKRSCWDLRARRAARDGHEIVDPRVATSSKSLCVFLSFLIINWDFLLWQIVDINLDVFQINVLGLCFGRLLFRGFPTLSQFLGALKLPLHQFWSLNPKFLKDVIDFESIPIWARSVYWKFLGCLERFSNLELAPDEVYQHLIFFLEHRNAAIQLLERRFTISRQHIVRSYLGLNYLRWS